MALTQTEARVMDRWDAGSGIPQIARQTGLTPTRVGKIVETYHCRPETRHHRTRMATASAALRKAILNQLSATGAPL